MGERKIWHKIIISLVVINFFSFSMTIAQTGREIAQKAFPSVVLLVMEDERGQPKSLGSGFLVRDGIVATNLHVVKESAGGYIKPIGQKTKHHIEGICVIDNLRDLVLLSVKDVKAPALEIGDSSQVMIGDEVYVVGNPMGLEDTFSQGIVSGIRQVGQDSLLQITAPISPGSSGGPVLNSEGKVIGVAAATFTGGQNLNFAIPVSYLTPLLSDIKSITSLSAKTQPREVKSILAELGGKSTEGVIAHHFLWTDNQYMGYYTFSVHNRLRRPIRNVYCLMIFYDKYGLPIETEEVIIQGPIGPNLGKRSERMGRLSADEVRNLTGKVEIRILDFQLVHDEEE